MSCNSPQTIETNISCAKFCTTKFNDAPIAELTYNSYVLSDSSVYYDINSIADRQVRWSLYVEDTLIYDFGFNYYYNTITELSNGSTYDELNLGVQNGDIKTFIETLPNTIIPTNTTFVIFIDVKDDTGIENTNISNKYYFTI